MKQRSKKYSPCMKTENIKTSWCQKGSYVLINKHENVEYIGLKGGVTEWRKCTKELPGKETIETRIYKVELEQGDIIWVEHEQVQRVKRPAKSTGKYKAEKFNFEMAAKASNLLPTYVTLVEFCILKECWPTSVYNLIKKGIIEVVSIGMTEERVMIDFKKYGNVEVYKYEVADRRREGWGDYYKRKHPRIYNTIMKHKDRFLSKLNPEGT